MPTSTLTANIPDVNDSITPIYIATCMPTSTSIFLDIYSGYNDEQFHADVRNAKSELDDLEQQALEEYEQGNARKFPG